MRHLIDSLNSLHEEMQGIEGTEIEVRIDWEYNVNNLILKYLILIKKQKNIE